VNNLICCLIPKITTFFCQAKKKRIPKNEEKEGKNKKNILSREQCPARESS
jgi:hypothetical protein